MAATCSKNLPMFFLYIVVISIFLMVYIGYKASRSPKETFFQPMMPPNMGGGGMPMMPPNMGGGGMPMMPPNMGGGGMPMMPPNMQMMQQMMQQQMMQQMMKQMRR